jgi:hypothetical protein
MNNPAKPFPQAPDPRPKMVSDYQAEFFSAMLKVQNAFNDMVTEVMGLNQVIVNLTQNQAKTAAPRGADDENPQPA